MMKHQQIVAICGLIGSGKDTVADILVSEYRFIKLSFAGILKDVVSILFGWDREMIEGGTPESRVWREIEDPYWTVKLGKPTSPRSVLQMIGTDIMRNHLHKNIWILALEKKVDDLVRDGKNIVFTDCRFANEFEFLRSKGGIVVRIERGNKPNWWYDYVERGMEPTGVHITEWGWINEPYDKYLNNDGTIIELKSKLRIFEERI